MLFSSSFYYNFVVNGTVNYTREILNSYNCSDVLFSSVSTRCPITVIYICMKFRSRTVWFWPKMNHIQFSDDNKRYDRCVTLLPISYHTCVLTIKNRFEKRRWMDVYMAPMWLDFPILLLLDTSVVAVEYISTVGNGIQKCDGEKQDLGATENLIS